MAFELPKLNYSYNALEPYFDSKTMEIHHSKHHAGYTNNLNKAIEGTEFESKTIEEILRQSNLPNTIRNNGGGYFNHCLFWEILSPNKVVISNEFLDLFAGSVSVGKYFKNLKYLVIDCLWYNFHPSHFNLESSLAIIKKFKPKKAILTNLSPVLDYKVLKKMLPKNIIPAHDGLTINL